jgi:NADPH2:quinone reductase
MKAVGVVSFGGPEALEVVELPDPEAGPGEVRIRVHAATVNPTDTGLRNGARAAQLKDIPPPYVPGMDAAGVLDQIGEGVSTTLRLGDRVMAIVVPSGSHGAYSELIVVPVESVVRVPAGSSDAQASTLPMNGLTTRMALDELDLQPGQILGVTGAPGAVGGYAIQLAKTEGLRVVADASPSDEQLVRDLGADLVVARGQDFADRVRQAVPEGVDGLIDAALLDQLAVPAVCDGGRIATVRGYRGAEDRGITFHPVFVRNYAREQVKLDRLRQLAEEGRVTLRVAAVLPADQAPDAHRRLEAGGTRGRLVLEF